MKNLFFIASFMTLSLYGAAVIASSLPLVSEGSYQTSDSTRTRNASGKSYNKNKQNNGSWPSDSTGRKNIHIGTDTIPR
jgi:hypothetical protein